MLCSQARQFTPSSWAQIENICSNLSSKRAIEPSERPTASTSSVSEGQKASERGRQSTFLQIISEIADLPQRQRSISRLIEALAKYPNIGRLHAILRIAAFFFSTPRLRSLEQRGSLFCSSPSTEQKKISPLELQTASMLPWQLYCWSRITPSCLQVQWKRGRTVSSLITNNRYQSLSYRHSQNDCQYSNPQSTNTSSPFFISLSAFIKIFQGDSLLSRALQFNPGSRGNSLLYLQSSILLLTTSLGSIFTISLAFVAIHRPIRQNLLLICNNLSSSLQVRFYELSGVNIEPQYQANTSPLLNSSLVKRPIPAPLI